MEISNSEVRRLAELAGELRSDYLDNDSAWEGSPFVWIKTRPSSQKGKIAEQLVAKWCVGHGLSVRQSPDREADRIIENVRVEIKSSTLWESGIYKFQQLRDQNYDLALCVGLSPFDAHCWILPKDEIMRRWQSGDEDIRSQHSGSLGEDTAWLSVDPAQPPGWLREYGGTLEEGMNRLRSTIGVG